MIKTFLSSRNKLLRCKSSMGRIVQQEDAKNEAHHVQLVKFEKKASRLPDDVTNLFSSIASKSERDRARVATTNEKRESEAR